VPVNVSSLIEDLSGTGGMSKRGSRSDTTFRLMPVNPKPPADAKQVQNRVCWSVL
jgi:hypothetical protein